MNGHMIAIPGRVDQKAGSYAVERVADRWYQRRMTLSCPKCDTPMEKKTVGAVVIDHCPGCAGLWFDEGELQYGLADGGRDELKRLSTAAQPPTEHDLKPADCPRCAAPLARVLSPGRSDLYVDVCGLCGGVWYDGGEVDDLLADGVGRRLGRFVKGLLGGR